MSPTSYANARQESSSFDSEQSAKSQRSTQSQKSNAPNVTTTSVTTGNHVTPTVSQHVPPVMDTTVPPPNNQRTTTAVRPHQRVIRTRSQQKAGLSPLIMGLLSSKKGKEGGKTPRPNAKGPPGGKGPDKKGRKDDEGPDFHVGKAN